MASVVDCEEDDAKAAAKAVKAKHPRRGTTARGKGSAGSCKTSSSETARGEGSAGSCKSSSSMSAKAEKPS